MRQQTLSREVFIDCINAIQQQHDHDSICNDAFEILLPSDYVTGYDNSMLRKGLMSLLKYIMNDSGEIIEYFILELDFGKEQTLEFCARNEDGSMIDLSDAGKLYSFLESS